MHNQAYATYRDVIQELKRKNGQKVRLEEAKMVITRCLELMIGKRKQDEGQTTLPSAARVVSSELHIDEKKVQKMVKLAIEARGDEFEECKLAITNAVDEWCKEDGRVTGGTGGKYKLSPEVYPQLMAKIQEELVQKKDHITGEKVQEIIREQFGVELGPIPCRAILRRLGFKYGRLKNQYKFTAQRRETIEQFLKEYDAAMKLEAAGTHIIVYMVRDSKLVVLTHIRRQLTPP